MHNSLGLIIPYSLFHGFTYIKHNKTSVIIYIIFVDILEHIHNNRILGVQYSILRLEYVRFNHSIRQTSLYINLKVQPYMSRLLRKCYQKDQNCATLECKWEAFKKVIC